MAIIVQPRWGCDAIMHPYHRFPDTDPAAVVWCWPRRWFSVTNNRGIPVALCNPVGVVMPFPYTESDTVPAAVVWCWPRRWFSVTNNRGIPVALCNPVGVVMQ